MSSLLIGVLLSSAGNTLLAHANTWVFEQSPNETNRFYFKNSIISDKKKDQKIFVNLVNQNKAVVSENIPLNDYSKNNPSYFMNDKSPAKTQLILFNDNDVMNLVKKSCVDEKLLRENLKRGLLGIKNYRYVFNHSVARYSAKGIQKSDGCLDFANKTDATVLAAYRGMVYDNYDFGNLLWGVAMFRLGIPHLIAKIGSELNGALGTDRQYNDNETIMKTFANFIQGDTAADQHAIRKGYQVGRELFKREKMGEFK